MIPASSGDQAMKVILFLLSFSLLSVRYVFWAHTGCPRQTQARTRRRRWRNGDPCPRHPGKDQELAAVARHSPGGLCLAEFRQLNVHSWSWTWR